MNNNNNNNAPSVEKSESLPEKPRQEQAKSSTHLLYAVEMLLFALIGWAWLAVREIMGDTPVLEVTVLLVMLVSSVLNLLFALTYYTTDQFKDPAKAFLNHTACVWLLFIFCQFQSSTDGRGQICCAEDGKKSLFSLRLTYKAAHFGGLALHQPAAAITLAFLSIFLILAASQARVCIENPREWPMHGKAPLAVVCLLCLQQGVFGLTAPVCKDQDLSAVVVGIAAFAWLTMLDVPWVLSRDTEPMMHLIQVGLEVALSLMTGVMAAVLALNLGGGDALLSVWGVMFLWQMGGIVTIIYDIKFPSATSNATQTKTFTQPYYNSFTPTSLLLPEARDLKIAREKIDKAR
jgi:hypothetical protein